MTLNMASSAEDPAKLLYFNYLKLYFVSRQQSSLPTLLRLITAVPSTPLISTYFTTG